MTLLDRFRSYYQHFDHDNFDVLGDIYCQDIQFSDPVHKIDGLPELKAYFAQMCSGLESCRFEFVGETIAAESAWFKWEMYYQHPKLQGGKELQLTGASYLRFTEDAQLIAFHEDFYDMGSMLYEHVPMLGSGVRWLKQRLAHQP